MLEATKKRPRVFDFRGDPPAIAYLDPSPLPSPAILHSSSIVRHKSSGNLQLLGVQQRLN